MMLLLYPAAQVPLMAFTTGLVSNGLWVLGLWAFLTTSGLNIRKVGWIVICVGLVGPIFFNNVYTWPKLLAASYFLSALAIAIDRDLKPSVYAGLLGALSALALLSHGAIAFALIGSVTLLLRPALFSMRPLVIAAASSALLYAPWIAYQHWVDPPGDRLLKWHLAGQISITNQDAASAIAKSYESAGFEKVIAWKAENALSLIGLSDIPVEWSRLIMPNWCDSALGRVKQRLLSYVALVPGLYLVGLLLYLLQRRPRPWLRPVVISVIGTSITFVLLEQGSNFSSTARLHLSPMSLPLLWSVVCIGAIVDYPWLARATLILNVAATAAIWVVGNGAIGVDSRFQPDHFSQLMIFTQLATLSTLLAIAWRWVGKEGILVRQSGGDTRLAP
jgi:hypothetical protein